MVCPLQSPWLTYLHLKTLTIGLCFTKPWPGNSQTTRSVPVRVAAQVYDDVRGRGRGGGQPTGERHVTLDAQSPVQTRQQGADAPLVGEAKRLGGAILWYQKKE